MYVYVKSMLRKKNTDEPWKEVNIANMMLSTLFNNYSSGYIKLTNKYLSKPVYLDLQEFKAMDISTPELTFNLWLSYIGDKTFVTNEIEPVFKEGVVTYCDAWQAGYNIQRMNVRYTDTENMVNGDLPNLYITKSGVSSDILNQYALTLVNGYLHFSDIHKNGLTIFDGAKTIDKSGLNQVGLISFMNIGPIKQVKIKDNMITNTVDNVPLSRGLFINLNQDINKYKVLISIGGYLHYGKDCFSIVNSDEGIIRVDIDSINIHEKLLLAMNDLDLNEGSLGISEHFPNSIVKEKILSDASLRHFFTHNTTFVILVDTEIMSVERIMMDNVKLFHMYEYHKKPTLPMIDYYGRMPIYHFIKEPEKYIIKVLPQYANFANYKSTDGSYNRLNGVTAPSYHNKSVGHFLEIKGYKLA